MRRSAVGVLSAIFLASGLLTPAQADSTKVETKSVVVKEPLSSKQILAAEPKINEFIFDPTINLNLDQLNQALKDGGLDQLGNFTSKRIRNPSLGILKFSSKILSEEALQISQKISSLEIFGQIQPNQVFQTMELSPQRQSVSQYDWALDRLDQDSGINGLYEYDSTGEGVDVYVLDSGIDIASEEIKDNIQGGFSVTGESFNSSACGMNSWNDGHEDVHGTHVAGIIAGKTSGVAKDATIIPVRVIDCLEDGYTEDIVFAIGEIIRIRSTALTFRPAVINMSLGGPLDTVLNDAVQDAIEAGITVVVASGNSTADACSVSPASAPNAITVNATFLNTQKIENRATFSNFGSCTDIFAPGQDIPSTRAGATDGTRLLLDGTSMAAPFVSGVAARILEKNPNFSPSQVTSEIFMNSLSFTSERANDANRLLHYEPAVRAFAQTGTPAIEGYPVVGDQLTVEVGTWDAGVSLSYQWFLNDSAITNSNSSTFQINHDHFGSEIEVEVTGAKSGYQSVTKRSEPFTMPRGLFSTPANTGWSGLDLHQVGDQLNFVATTEIPGTTIEYQWFRRFNTDQKILIPGATTTTYKTQSADQNYSIYVEVTQSKSGYDTLVSSFPMGLVVAIPTSPPVSQPVIEPVTPPTLIDPPFPGSAIPASLKARKVLTINLSPGGTNALGHPVSVYASGGCSAKGFTVTQTQNVPTLKKVKVREKYTTVDKRGKTVTKTRTVTQTQTVLVKKKVKVLGGYKVTMGKKGTSCQLTTIVNGTNPYKTSSRVNTISVT